MKCWNGNVHTIHTFTGKIGTIHESMYLNSNLPCYLIIWHSPIHRLYSLPSSCINIVNMFLHVFHLSFPGNRHVWCILRANQNCACFWLNLRSWGFNYIFHMYNNTCTTYISDEKATIHSEAIQDRYLRDHASYFWRKSSVCLGRCYHCHRTYIRSSRN